MRYLLDTNACIDHLRTGSSAITRRLGELEAGDVALCSVVKAELFFGALMSRDPQGNLDRVERFVAPFASLPFDDLAAATYGRIRRELALQGTPIGPNDLMIAAIAASRNVTLVTGNTREFSRVPLLQIENWLET